MQIAAARRVSESKLQAATKPLLRSVEGYPKAAKTDVSTTLVDVRARGRSRIASRVSMGEKTVMSSMASAQPPWRRSIKNSWWTLMARRRSVRGSALISI